MGGAGYSNTTKKGILFRNALFADIGFATCALPQYHR